MTKSEKFTLPGANELRRLEMEARRVRAEVVADLFARLFRAIGRAAGAVLAGIANLGAAWRDARRARETYAELSRLSDRELADIGLSRSDIPAVVAGLIKRDVPAATPAPVTDLAEAKAARPAVPQPAERELADAA